jgi:hypothetical protein
MKECSIRATNVLLPTVDSREEYSIPAINVLLCIAYCGLTSGDFVVLQVAPPVLVSEY